MTADPQAFANYRRDKSHMIGHVFGPTALDEWWRAVTCDYDPDSDSSRVGFVIVPATELEAIAQQGLHRLLEAQRADR